MTRLSMLLVVGAVVLVSGCVNSAAGLDAGSSVDVSPEKIYELRECHGDRSNPDPCKAVDIEFTNNGQSSTVFAVTTHGIVYSDGSQMGVIADLPLNLDWASDECYVSSQDEGTSLLPGGKETLTLCFSEIDFSKDPNLVIKIRRDFEADYDIESLGYRRTGGTEREVTFDLENTPREDPGEKHRPYEVLAWMAHHDHEYRSEEPPSGLPASPDDSQEYTLSEYDFPSDYFDGGFLYVYAFYDDEKVRCSVEEYYDGSLHGEFTVELVPVDRSVESSQPLSMDSTRIAFEKDVSPDEVTYDIACEGYESYREAQTSLDLELAYP